MLPVLIRIATLVVTIVKGLMTPHVQVRVAAAVLLVVLVLVAFSLLLLLQPRRNCFTKQSGSNCLRLPDSGE